MNVIYSESDEKALLGCLIGDADTLKKHVDSIRESDFFVPAHKQLFREICHLHDAGELIRPERFKNDDLILFAECLSASVLPNCESYLRIVKRDSVRRLWLENHEIDRAKVIEDPTFLAAEDDGLSARDAIDLANDETITEPPILVSGMLHKGSALLLGASSKSFKSWSLIDLAVSVASGSPWWSLPCEKGAVLFVDFELTPHFWRKRAMEIAKARGLSLDGIRIINCRGYSPEDALRAIDREAKARSFALICIDPLYSFLAGKDENSAGDVGAVMRRLAMLPPPTSRRGRSRVDKAGGGFPAAKLIGVFSVASDALKVSPRCMHHPHGRNMNYQICARFFF